jgi:hypothetical protein
MHKYYAEHDRIKRRSHDHVSLLHGRLRRTAHPMRGRPARGGRLRHPLLYDSADAWDAFGVAGLNTEQRRERP